MENGAPKFRFAVYLFSFIAGAASLSLGMMWMRMLSATFGSTAYATRTILTTLLLGLMLGALLLGRKADRSGRPLGLYAYLSIGIGLYGLVFPWIAAWMSSAYVWFYRAVDPGAFLLGAIRLAMSIVLIPGTFLMGGALPPLGRFLSRGHPETGRETTRLYGTAVLGAAAGCFISGFFLLPTVGARVTAALAACAAITAGLLAIGLARINARARNREVKQAGEAAQSSNMTQKLKPKALRGLLVACGIAGFCLLACKILWGRVLVYTMNSSSYSSTTFLTVFLMGIAIGMHVSARLIVPRLRSGLLSFATVQMLTGLAILASFGLLQALPAIHMNLQSLLSSAGSWRHFIMRFGEASIIMLGPTLLTGAALTIAAAVYLSAGDNLGRRTGDVFSAHTIGCVLGWIAAFFVLPVAGVQYSLLGIGAISLGAGLFLIAASGVRPIRLVVAGVLSAALVVIAASQVMPANLFYDAFNTRNDLSRITWVRESAAGNITVHILPNGRRRLAVDGVDIGGSDIALRTTQKLQAYIPLCLHTNPKRVMQIGWGWGEAAEAGLKFEIENYTVVEPRQDVFDAGKCFGQTNCGSDGDSRIRRVAVDGKSFALLCREKFDIIISETLHPGLDGTSTLFTAEHFDNCRGRLRRGGLFACRVPLSLQPIELCTIISELKKVFEQASIWSASNCLNEHVLIIAGDGPLHINLKRINTLMSRPRIAEDLASIEIHNAYDLLDCHLCDDNAVVKMLTDLNALRTHCDDLPLLEFNIADFPTGTSGKQTLSMLATHHTPIIERVEEFAEQHQDVLQLGQRFEATRCILQAQLAEMSGLAYYRKRMLEKALQANPGEVHVKSCQNELDSVIRDLKQMAQARPHNRTVSERLADKLFMAMRYDEAAPIYERLIASKMAPSPSTFVNLAEIRYHYGRADEAEVLLRGCLDRWPRSAEAHDRLGGIYVKMGRINAARYHAGQAVRIEPTNVIYRQHLEKTGQAH